MKVSLKIKFFLGIALMVIFGIAAGSINFIQERKAWEENFEEQAIILGHALNASIGSMEALQNRGFLQNSIYKLMLLNSDIIRADINHVAPEGLQIIASNVTTDIGLEARPSNLNVLRTGETIVRRTEMRGEEVLSVVSPIYIAGKTMGTYEIFLSLSNLENTIQDRYFRFITVLIVGFSIMAMSGLFLIYLLVLRPINGLSKAIEEFGSGNFGYRIKDYPKDEIGNVARMFNSMSKSLETKYGELKGLNEQLANAYRLADQKVKERTAELEKAKTSLEEKVKERTKELERLKADLEKKVDNRTKELRQKLAELEKFHKLAVDRELKMVELKQELDELKERFNRL